MPNLANWVQNDNLKNLFTPSRIKYLAGMTWRKIQERPSTITIYRNGVAQDPQTVRIEVSNFGNFREVFPGGQVGDQDMIIVGVKGHPTIVDLDIQRGDMFIYDDKEFEIRDTITTNNGWVQGLCDVTS